MEQRPLYFSRCCSPLTRWQQISARFAAMDNICDRQGEAHTVRNAQHRAALAQTLECVRLAPMATSRVQLPTVLNVMINVPNVLRIKIVRLLATPVSRAHSK